MRASVLNQQHKCLNLILTKRDTETQPQPNLNIKMKAFIPAVFGLLLAGGSGLTQARPQFSSFPSRPSVSSTSSASSLVSQIITQLTPFVQEEIQNALGSRPAQPSFGSGGFGSPGFGSGSDLGFGSSGSIGGGSSGAGEPFDVSELFNIYPFYFLCLYSGFFVRFRNTLSEKTQALKKFKVFSALKIKLPEVFRPILQNSRYQSIKTQGKYPAWFKICLKTHFFLKRRAIFTRKLRNSVGI